MAEFRDPFGRHREYRRRRNPSEIRSHFFQCYKGVPQVPPGFEPLWAEISKDELVRDTGITPKIIDKEFWYVMMEGRDYIFTPCFAAIIFYNHADQSYIYMRADGSLIKESNIFDSYESARSALNEKLKRMEGKVSKIICPDGSVITPIYDNE